VILILYVVAFIRLYYYYLLGAPCLPCCCCGPNCEFDGCALVKVQMQVFCLAITAAIPCDEEVPPIVSILGLTVFPKCGCCMPIKEAMSRD
jgi:hypothetical protein